MADYINNDVAMGWDDTIENDNEFTILPEGSYDFEVLGFERKRFEGSAKLSACPKAEVKIKLFDRANPDKGSSTIVENLLLNRKMEWKLCQFFTAIGMRKHGEPLRMNWGAITGKTGRCKVIVNSYTTDKGEERENNRIDKFYEPVDAPQTKSGDKPFVPGEF